ncbi:unnamed protein product [Parascedosporium putredinis]|uniref:Serine hydrolase domain-containing protein n=1 Tax=Parascedosporium putredinis TaxID=1442378 RepID=A0A9P1GVU1_9PEZI|nr:unnamed protein product [Parascedosporium putredinis]CAI7988292.1 unnamed protein product [Parascedosporium putredinis]
MPPSSAPSRAGLQVRHHHPTPPQPSKQNQRAPKAPKVPKKELKVLMLHGYTQSGPLFRAKTRALEKLLAKSLAPLDASLTLHYPTAPMRLRPSDIPGFVPASDVQHTAPEDDELDSWAWFRRDAATPTLFGFDEGMRAVARAIADAGGVHGAGPDARKPPAAAEGWAAALREANAGRPLQFAVVYSGFFMPVDEVQWLYEPAIRTPTLHYIGGLDTVVEEARSRGLVERCVDPLEALHPGGHYVPITREWMMPITGFIRKFAEQLEEKDSPKLS